MAGRGKKPKRTLFFLQTHLIQKILTKWTLLHWNMWSQLFWNTWFFLTSRISLSNTSSEWLARQKKNNVKFIFWKKTSETWISQWWPTDFIGRSNGFTTWPSDSFCSRIDQNFHAGDQRKIMLNESSFHHCFYGSARRLKMFCPLLVSLGEFLACACLNNPSPSRLYFSCLSFLEQLLREKVTKTSCGIHSHMFIHTRLLPAQIL